MEQLAASRGSRPTLADLRVRPFGPADADRLRRMSALLSRGSLYTRFFTGTPRIPEPYVSALHGLDHWDREALVALLDGELVGVAEYVRDRDRPCRAEVAALVADPWQRHGLGGLLVACLVPLAQRRGITEFGAEVIYENRPALSAIRRYWPAVAPADADGAASFRLPLPIPG
ncbi:GNAT family N-acetyltransferase [Actinomadura hibisca]|uniref:GNAT family N-acetyltransferase n=1 Tax=Actinomadura hibisca TaxID=68565 RepID=UPI000AE5A4C6|nr:GNAT family N-acetyltransferase [Actinomadura hibisca]